jgi:MoaA/NifB/PqqE/SkfB family radical SAM enzyme
MPPSTSLRRFQEDERCRFRPLQADGLRVVVRLTTGCDLACPHCLVETRKRTEELDTRAWLQVFDGLSDVQARKVLLTGGEPLLRDDLGALIRHISAMGIPVDLNSNLQRASLPLLREFRNAGLTEISVSLEGPPEVHDRMHGKQGAFARLTQAVRWAADLGMQVDGACCLTAENLPHLNELFDLAHSLPLQSFTVSRLLPIGHGRKSSRALPQEALTRAHAHLQQDVMPNSQLPIRLVGLLHPPQDADCQRGRSLVGLTPAGELVGCVLASENPSGVPLPAAVGLPRALAVLRERLAGGQYALCWKE